MSESTLPAPDVKDFRSALGQSIVEELKRQWGAQWDQLSINDRALFQAVSNDAAQIHLEAALSPPGAQLDSLVREKAHVDAQLANLESMAVETARSVFWGSVRTVLSRVIGLAFAVIPAASA